MSSSDAPVTDDTRPVHDRPTLISYASMSAWSWFVYAFGASLVILVTLYAGVMTRMLLTA